jgi:lipoate-protein ligase A
MHSGGAVGTGARIGSGVRWIPPLRASGSLQMAIDEELLDAAVAAGERARPVLRLYQWRRPTLSLGFHQRAIEPVWSAQALEGRLDLVRRPSGGRAVLHGGDLTYALIWPAPGLPRMMAYRRACLWLQEVFAELGQPLQFGDHRPTSVASSCFALATAADLIHPGGSKRIGSAQLWRRGHLLQHGSIQLAPSGSLWRLLFDEAPPGLPALPIDTPGLMARLADAAEALWGGLESQPLTPQERRAAWARRDRYRLPLETGSASAAGTSPLPSMPRAT